MALSLRWLCLAAVCALNHVEARPLKPSLCRDLAALAGEVAQFQKAAEIVAYKGVPDSTECSHGKTAAGRVLCATIALHTSSEFPQDLAWSVFDCLAANGAISGLVLGNGGIAEVDRPGSLLSAIGVLRGAAIHLTVKPVERTTLDRIRPPASSYTPVQIDLTPRAAR